MIKVTLLGNLPLSASGSLRQRVASLARTTLLLATDRLRKIKDSSLKLLSFILVKRIIANKNIVIFKVNNAELFCQVELPLSDYPLYGKQIAAS